MTPLAPAPHEPEPRGADRYDRTMADDGRRETPVEKLDRNWNEILQELRVTQTGIQILTGFLLTVPFQTRFTELTGDQRGFYLVLVVLAAVTTGLMVAPVSLHRWLFRKGAKSTLVTAADRFMRVGLVFLSLVVSGVVGLVFDVVAARPCWPRSACWCSSPWPGSGSLPPSPPARPVVRPPPVTPTAETNRPRPDVGWSLSHAWRPSDSAHAAQGG